MTRTSLVSAAALMDDYFSALLAIGRRARIQKNEYFLVNAKYSRTALAAIDIATGIFCAKVYIPMYFTFSTYKQYTK